MLFQKAKQTVDPKMAEATRISILDSPPTLCHQQEI